MQLLGLDNLLKSLKNKSILCSQLAELILDLVVALDILASVFLTDPGFEFEEGLMQASGQESIKDPSYINKLNTGIFQVSYGQACFHAIRHKTVSG